MDADEQPLLDVQHLSTVFEAPGAGLRAADDVSFTVRRGETVGLAGESGCGKTVTACSILRIVQPPGRIVGGRVLFEGADLLRLSEAEMRQVRGARIGMVFQEPGASLNPVFTVGDQIAEAMEVHGVSRRVARAGAVDLLDAVKVPDAARRARDYPHQLSGGLQQRVVIAMALACRPSLVIADEPTSALDVTVQAEILDLLRAMRSVLGLSLLLVTHDLGVLAGMADRVAVMYAGRIVEQGPVREVLRSPVHPYTRALLAAASGGDGRRFRAIDGVVPALDALPPGCAFAPRCPDRLPACELDRPAVVPVGVDREARCLLPEAAPGWRPAAGHAVQPAGSGTQASREGRER